MNNEVLLTNNSFYEGQTVFALWTYDAHYYLGVISKIEETQIKISFDDGELDWVNSAEIFDVNFILTNFDMQGNWRQLGKYYPCKLISQATDEPLIIRYQDGVEEKVKLSQLRFAKSQRVPSTNFDSEISTDEVKNLNLTNVKSDSVQVLDTKACVLCGKKLNLFSSKATLLDGRACSKCLADVGIRTFENSNSFNVNTLSEYIKQRSLFVQNFTATKIIKPEGLSWLSLNTPLCLAIDEDNKTFAVGKALEAGAINKSDLFEMSNLLDYELLENGNTLTETITEGKTKKKWIGRTIVGGALFGPAGAIIGASTGKTKSKSKSTSTSTEVCTSMKIKMTLKNSHVDVLYLDLVTTEIKIGESEYNILQMAAHKFLAALQMIIDMNETDTSIVYTSFDVATELQCLSI